VGLQTSDRSFDDVWASVGFQGLFRGAAACICRDVIFTAICFPLYKELLDMSIHPFVAGAVSGVIASFAATPPDVIKTRILAQDDHAVQQKQPQRTFLKRFPLQPAAAVAAVGGGVGTSQVALYWNMNATFIDEEEEVTPWDSYYTTQEQQPSSSISNNPWVVFRSIVENEGPSVLFSGYKERCLGAIPRFGTTLAVHDFLESYLHTHNMIVG
jgi:hypothetical protein